MSESNMEKIIILENKRYKINKPELTIGRGKECDIRLNDDKISRLHARILTLKNDIYIEDNGSSNGTYLNNKLITGKKKIKVGDIIQLGSFVLKVDFEVPTKQYPALDPELLKKEGFSCPHCKKHVSKDVKYCVFCGKPVKELEFQSTVPCPKCGKPIAPTTDKCPFCGIELSEETYELDLSEITPVYITAKKKKKDIKIQEKPIASDIETEVLSLGDDSKKLRIRSIAPGNPAGFWVRTFAILLDAIFFSILQAIFVIVPAYFYFTKKFGIPDFSHPIKLYDKFIQFGNNAYIIISIGFFIIALLYFPISWATKGTTPGKAILKLYIFRNSTATTPLSFISALIRFVSYIFSMILFIGFIMIAFRKDKRGLHDLIASTVVYHKMK
ncbi:MAG: RDD family protein [Acidobacteria bacterium]|nr:RDD family protein [Acidobacteriota bacterium]